MRPHRQHDGLAYEGNIGDNKTALLYEDDDEIFIGQPAMKNKNGGCANIPRKTE